MPALALTSPRAAHHCPQATAVLALGNMHPACHALVLGESAVLAEDYPDRQMQRVRIVWGYGRGRGGMRGWDCCNFTSCCRCLASPFLDSLPSPAAACHQSA